MEIRKTATTLPPTTRSRWRGIVVAAVVFGWGWAAILLLGIASPLVGFIGLVGSGLATGLYLAPLYWVRGRPRDIAAAGCIGFLGGTHLVWILMAQVLCNGMAFPAELERGSLFVVTGLVFGLAIGLASRSLWMGLGVSFAGLISGLSAVLFDRYGWGDSSSFIGCAVLHISLVSAVAYETTRLLTPTPEQVPIHNVCARCGYSLVGLAGDATCPECGTERSG